MATLEQRVSDRTQQLTTLFEITMLAGEAQSLPEVLEPAIERLAHLGYCQAVCIHLISAEGMTLDLVAQRGLAEPIPQHMYQIQTAQLAQFLDPAQKLSLVGKVDELPEFIPQALRPPGFQVYFGNKLRAHGTAVGILSAYRTDDQPFSISQISLLTALADQLGIAVENHRLQNDSRKMVMLAERQRLARELHDSITQSLYSQTLFARAGRYALEDGDEEKARESLLRLETDTLAVLKEMRVLLFQLQPLALRDVSLQEAIEQRFDNVERRLGIEATSQIENNGDLEAEMNAEIYRVVVEALNNSLKHASAKHVDVMLQPASSGLHLVIADNGTGFDIDQTKPGMGLRSMRERIAQLGGELAIHASPSNGTRISANLPLSSG